MNHMGTGHKRQENPKAAENFRAVAGLSLGEYTALFLGPKHGLRSRKGPPQG